MTDREEQTPIDFLVTEVRTETVEVLQMCVDSKLAPLVPGRTRVTLQSNAIRLDFDDWPGSPPPVGQRWTLAPKETS